MAAEYARNFAALKSSVYRSLQAAPYKRAVEGELGAGDAASQLKTKLLLMDMANDGRIQLCSTMRGAIIPGDYHEEAPDYFCYQMTIIVAR